MCPSHGIVKQLLFPGGSVSFIHEQQKESYLFDFIIVCLLVDCDVKFSILDKLFQVLPLSIKGFWRVQFDFFDFRVMVVHDYIRHFENRRVGIGDWGIWNGLYGSGRGSKGVQPATENEADRSP